MALLVRIKRSHHKEKTKVKILCRGLWWHDGGVEESPIVKEWTNFESIVKQIHYKNT